MNLISWEQINVTYSVNRMVALNHHTIAFPPHKQTSPESSFRFSILSLLCSAPAETPRRIGKTTTLPEEIFCP